MENEKKTMKESHILAIQMVFIAGIAIGSGSIDLNEKHTWMTHIARFIFYLLTMQATREASKTLYGVAQGVHTLDLDVLERVNRSLALVWGAAAAILLSSGQSLFSQDFTWLFAAFLAVNYTNRGPAEMTQRLTEEPKATSTTINYGTGMACSFFEGYFMHIMTSDGHTYGGLVENLRKFEDQQGQVFPVKKMFLVVPKSLFCPPDLKHFNKLGADRDGYKFPFLEPLKSLEDVQKDVAAVKNRVYRNSVYKIYRREPAAPVCLAVECPTPLHTLYKVLNKRHLYTELCDMNVEQIVQDFESTLVRILEADPQTRGKVVFVHFDDTDEKLNLSEVLLDKIREIEPDFEDIIIKGSNR